jgi:hypothetical protein
MGHSYNPVSYYGLIPGSYRERGGPQFGLVPWPKHLQPRKTSTQEEAGRPAPKALPSLVNAGGVFFVTLSPDDRAGIATTIERLINMLDTMDGDENLEETGDSEPSLGWPEYRGLSQLATNVPHDDREEENEHGGDINDEPHDDDELEPFLGWSETCGNGEPPEANHGSAVLVDDPEADGGSLDFRGDGYRQAREALRSRRVSPFPREYAERVTIMPDGEQFRTFVPVRRGRP